MDRHRGDDVGRAVGAGRCGNSCGSRVSVVHPGAVNRVTAGADGGCMHVVRHSGGRGRRWRSGGGADSGRHSRVAISRLTDTAPVW